MKKSLYIILLIIGVVFLVSCEKENPIITPEEKEVDIALGTEFESIGKEKKIYLTTAGQADLDIVQNILESATSLTEDEGFTKNHELKASDVEVGSVVILVIGSSSKGLGSAGTNVTNEKIRAEALAEKAVAGDFTLIVVHVGGQGRRGDMSDPIISAVSPSANLLLVVVTGDQDDLFTNIAKNNHVPLYLFSKSTKMVSAFETLFS